MSFPIYLIPVEAKTDSARVWFGFSSHMRPPGLNIFSHYRVVDAGGAVVSEAQFPSTDEASFNKAISGAAGHSNFFFKLIDVSGLSSATDYELHVGSKSSSDFASFSQCRFKTLPKRSDIEGSRFNIFLGSCFDYREDEGRLGKNYMKVWNHLPHLRPHHKLLVGDQVYVDLPWSEQIEMLFAPPSAAEVESKINAKYSWSWWMMRDVLQNGVTTCLPDDHEYWNDYPNVGGDIVASVHLAAFDSNPTLRKRWEKVCKDMVKNVQQVSQPVRTLNIGEGALPVFILDTRTDRKPDEQAFLTTAQKQAIGDWIKTLRGPGLLAMSQPLVRAPGKSETLGSYTGDYNWLWKTLDKSQHDIVVAAGDVHFSRVAEIQMSNARIIEVISSPLGMISGGSTMPEQRLAKAVPETTPPVVYAAGKVFPVAYREKISTHTQNDFGSFELARNGFSILSFDFGEEETILFKRRKALVESQLAQSSKLRALAKEAVARTPRARNVDMLLDILLKRPRPSAGTGKIPVILTVTCFRARHLGHHEDIPFPTQEYQWSTPLQ